AGPLPWLPYGRDGLSWAVGDGEEAEIGGGDLALPRHSVPQPLREAAPVFRSEQDHREVFHLPGLDQRKRLEQLVHRPVTPGEDDERGRVFDEHRLADEKVAEVDRALDIRIEPLLERQLDVAADRQAVSLLGPAVRGLHDPGPPPVMMGNPSSASMRAVSTALS